MTEERLVVSREVARRFLVRVFALDGFQTLPDVKTAIDTLESVQEDSINICGRIHDLILWPRVQGYTTAHLAKALYQSPRQAFEYYFPNLHVLPLRDLPLFYKSMEKRRHAEGRWHRLTAEEEPVAERLLTHISDNGPLRTRAAGSEEGHTTSGWGTRTTVAARVTEKLWLQGRLGIARRENFERYFELWDRCFLDEVENTHQDADAEAVYLVRKRLRTRRLFRLKKLDQSVLGKDAVHAVYIEGETRPWHILTEDLPLLLDCRRNSVPDVCHLLAPLDPLIYDRDRNRALWDFDYIWEVYTPVAKRQWGYYVLPILYGDKIVGRVDPKLNRKTKTLNILSLQWEPGVDAKKMRPIVEDRLQGFAEFLGAEEVALLFSET